MAFTSLSAFYNSQEWRLFRQNLIFQRTNPKDGVLYSEYSGNPLIKSYDIVLHHKIPLTMKNVNDYSISLNPDKIMIVSQKEHNEIHSRFGFASERKVYLVYGAPCSGKTTFVNNIKGNSDLIVDIDNIWQCITGGARYEKPNALKQNAFGVMNCLTDMIRTRAGKWEHAYVIEGGALKGDRERKAEIYGAELLFIDEDKETCLRRLYGDTGRTDEQKKEWERYIDRWFNDYTG